MLQENQEAEVNEVFESLDAKPAEPKSTEQPKRQSRKAKPEPAKANGGANAEPIYFLVSGPDKITAEEDGERAAAQAILNGDLRLYRAVPIDPREVFRGK